MRLYKHSHRFSLLRMDILPYVIHVSDVRFNHKLRFANAKAGTSNRRTNHVGRAVELILYWPYAIQFRNEPLW